jgi:hypothetical protein
LATAEHHGITRNAESSIEERPHGAIAAANGEARRIAANIAKLPELLHW